MRIYVTASDITVKVPCDAKDIIPTGTALHCTSRRLPVNILSIALAYSKFKDLKLPRHFNKHL